MAPHGQSCLKGIVSFLGGCYRITQLSDLSVFFDKTRPASLRQSLQANWEPLITQTKTFAEACSAVSNLIFVGPRSNFLAVIRPEWTISDPLNPGPEAYAPPSQRAPQEPSSDARVAVLRAQTAEPSQSNETAHGNLDALIRRVAATSMDEIDKVIHELEKMREMLRNEGERVSREIGGYASLSQLSVSSMKAISDPRFGRQVSGHMVKPLTRDISHYERGFRSLGGKTNSITLLFSAVGWRFSNSASRSQVSAISCSR
jgi:hypothetical protein